MRRRRRSTCRPTRAPARASTPARQASEPSYARVVNDAFARADWKLRSQEFGSLHQMVRASDRFVVMELVSPGVDDLALVEPLWDLWLGLPYHPCLLRPVEKADHGRLLVRYAALDWKHKPLRVDEPGASAAMVATWGIVLTR